MGIFDHVKKIDLHCHLDGSLPVETIQKLAQNIQKELPPREALLSRMRVKDDCENLGEYLKCFELPLPFLCTEQNFKDAVLGVLEDVSRENVVYIELRFSPLMSAWSGLPYDRMIAGAVEGMKEGSERYGVMGNLILCGMRHMPVEENIRMLRIGREFFREGVCGADMAGDEASYPILGQSAFFEEAKRLEMPFTIHAGECGSAGSVAAAVALGAKRIGHGIAARKDEALMEECRRKRITFELCPISNLQTKAIESKEEYPFEKFRQRGLLLTINTDNRMVSGTSLDREFEWLQEQYGITEEDAKALTENALEASFAEDDIKQEIWKRLR
ncbi:MAG: adenosine deaminase [Lachnospiraceae bacterium]|nr:adenosine deaminase [Lachnospiraceae bacterium]